MSYCPSCVKINLLAEVQSNRPTIVAVRRGAGAVLAPVRTRV